MTTTIHATLTHPTLGEIVLIAGEAGLQQLTFTGQRHDRPIPASSRHDPAAPVLRDAAEQLAAYLAGELHTFTVAVAPEGTPFQRSVWDALTRIPFGHTTTYGAIAGALPAASSARAVGTAVGRNPISVIVPCHRVVGASGALTGYAGGLPRKEHLLRIEGVLPPVLAEPTG